MIDVRATLSGAGSTINGPMGGAGGFVRAKREIHVRIWGKRGCLATLWRRGSSESNSSGDIDPVAPRWLIKPLSDGRHGRTFDSGPFGIRWPRPLRFYQGSMSAWCFLHTCLSIAACGFDHDRRRDSGLCHRATHLRSVGCSNGLEVGKRPSALVTGWKKLTLLRDC
jgi:hypothetical protein